MKIKVYRTSGRWWKKKAFDATVRFDTKVNDLESYIMEHSPIRAEMFGVDLEGIPVFASTHFVRHKIGVEHFILTQRDDRGGINDGRWTPTNHLMLLNAQAFINIAQDRLCLKSHKETVKIMSLMKKAVKEISPDLAKMMVPSCVYRGGLCKEGRNTCGKKERILKKYSYYKELFV